MVSSQSVHRRRRAAAAAILAAAAALALAAAAVAAEQRYVMAVVPSGPPVAIHQKWSPVVERLAQATGVGFALKVYEKMSDFEADLEQGGPDFVLCNPVQIVISRAAQGYLPLVRSSLPLTGVLFVPADSPIRTVEQLEGRPIAFVGAKSV